MYINSMEMEKSLVNMELISSSSETATTSEVVNHNDEETMIIEKKHTILAKQLSQSVPEMYNWLEGYFERDWIRRMLHCKKQNVPKAYQAIMESIDIRRTMNSPMSNPKQSPIPIRGFEPIEQDHDVDLTDHALLREIRHYISWAFHKYSKSYAPLFIIRAVSSVSYSHLLIIYND
jgi:hypothetical protein